VTEFSYGETEYNVAYRWELINIYTDFAWQSPYFGWGTFESPAKGEFASMDNAYLLFFFTYGLVSLIIFLMMLAWVFGRLCLFGLQRSKINPFESTLAFTLLSVLGTMAFCLLTVFMGLQIEILFFLFIGWAEGLLKYKTKEVYAVQPT
jgi:hypothetical protein